MVTSVILVTAVVLRLQSPAGQDKNAVIADLRAGRFNEARQILKQSLEKSPQDAALWTLNGFALLHLGEPTQALLSYSKAIDLSPGYLPALEGAAQIEYQSSNQNAVPLLRKIVSLHPGDETSHAMLATLAVDRHDCQTAVSEFQQSPTLIESSAKSLENYGSCLLQLEKFDAAVKVFARLSEINPQLDNSRYNLAVVQVLAKRYRDALSTLQPLLSKKPHDADCLDVQAQAYEGLLDTPKAVESLQQAISSNPAVPQYYLDFADMSLAHGAYQVGIEMVSAGLKRLPQSAPLFLARGILYVQVDDYEHSQQDFQRAEHLDPELQYGRGIQGLADLQLNRLPQAEADVRSRLQKNPGDSFLWYLLGETLMREGVVTDSAEFREAVRSVEHAIQLQADFPLARNLLGRLYLDQGKLDDAIKQSRLAFEEDPTGKTASTALYHLMVALKKSGKSDETHTLAKKLAELREQARERENAERRFTLVQASPPSVGQH